MKLRFPNKLNPRLIIALAVLLAAFIIHSCKKDNSSRQQPEVLNLAMVNLAKQWYNATYPAAKANHTKLATESIGGSGPNAWNQTFVPYWDKANTYTIDSLAYIELPALKRGDMAMSFQNVNPASFNFSKSQSLTSLIIVNKNGNFYMYAMTILADSSYLNGNYNKLANNTYRHKDQNFSGNVYYHRMDGSFVNGWRFQNGLVTGVITLAAPGTPTGPVTQGANKPVVNVAEIQDCQTTTTTTYWEQCSYYIDDVNDENPFDCFDYTTEASYTTCSTVPVGSTGGGSSSNPTPPNPCTTPPADSSTTPVQALRFRVRVADPNPPGNPQPPGGIVDQTNQIGTSECTNNDPPSDTTKLTPCGLLKHIDSVMQNAQVASANNQIFNEIGTQHEYGIDVYFASFPPNGSYIISAPITNSNTTSVTTNFSWVTGNHTIDISHDHPQGDGPSPADVFSLFLNSLNTNLQNAGAAQLNYYENNGMITTVTKLDTYIITGANYDTLRSKYIQYKADTAAFNTNYRNLVDNNSGAYDKALLEIFGNSINIYESFNNKPPYSLYQLVNNLITKANCP
ncbi:MAG TPA: hypothetical protein VFE53_17925 [Mucilaginibacter sp.]|nr:hypothetical protein [Mucilaginibacter sp.]